MSEPLALGSLFAGIGGFELGLERTGYFTTRWQVEQSPYCRSILETHWPDVPRYEDVRDVGAHNLEPVQAICGGFPCQDVSKAGLGAGLEGERSGLWVEFVRILREMQPQLALIENVGALRARGLDVVLRDLDRSGYDAWWDRVSAAAVGAPQERSRIFVVAYAKSLGVERRRTSGFQIAPAHVAQEILERRRAGSGRPHWNAEPDVGRLVDGVPRGVARRRWNNELHALGNAVVPQVAEAIGDIAIRLLQPRA